MGNSIQHLGLNLLLPKTVKIIITTGKDGFDSCYTRDNAIMCSENFLKMPTEGLARIFAHELSHVISPLSQPRNEVYGILGFTSSPHMDLGKKVNGQILANPDAFTYQHDITTQDRETGETIPAVPVVPLLISRMRLLPSLTWGRI